MKLEEFALEVQQEVEKRMGSEFEVSLQDVHKNNHVIMQGLCVKKKGLNIAPTVYLESFFEAYQEGKEMEEILETLLQIVREGVPTKSFDTGFFQDFQKAKEKICYKLVNAEKNKELLEQVPHIPFLDLAVCFYYPLVCEEIGQGSILIRNRHMEQWKVGTKELWEIAERNTQRLFPAECYRIQDIVMELVIGRRAGKTENAGWDENEDEAEMRVITNAPRVFGAVTMCYDGYLAGIAERIGRNLFILPSSIHEIILLPDVDTVDGEQLKEMVKSINTEQLEPQDVLSDSVYYYDRRSGKVSRI